ncbi:unnamed protein product [Ectocarpus sp. 8 AP-2014]
MLDSHAIVRRSISPRKVGRGQGNKTLHTIVGALKSTHSSDCTIHLVAEKGKVQHHHMLHANIGIIPSKTNRDLPSVKSLPFRGHGNDAQAPINARKANQAIILLDSQQGTIHTDHQSVTCTIIPLGPQRPRRADGP